MISVTASLLLGATATTGRAIENIAAANQTAAFDTRADAAIAESVLWNFGATSDDGDGRVHSHAIAP